MDARYTRIAYAYTPRLGEKPIYNVDAEIDGRPHNFEIQADDRIEAWQVICQRLNIPFKLQQ
jgi:hypothetical protein